MIAIRRIDNYQKTINVVLEIPANTTLNYLSSPYAISRALGLSLSATSERIRSFDDEEKISKLLKGYTILQGTMSTTPCKLLLFRMCFTSKDAMEDFIEDKLMVFDDFIESFTISAEIQKVLEALDNLRYYSIEDFYTEILVNKNFVDGGKARRFLRDIDKLKQNIEYELSKKTPKEVH